MRKLKYEKLLRLEPRCRVCDCILTEENWLPSHQRYQNYICRVCWREESKKYQRAWRKKKQVIPD